MMIGRCVRQQDLDAEPLRRLGQAVDECVVGLLVGAQQKLALRAAAGDHVEPTGNDLTRQGHDTVSARIRRMAIVMRVHNADNRPTAT